MNDKFPGRENYTGPTSGWFGLLHHSMLCEESHDVMERVEYVVKNKPPHEVAIRLRNMIYIDPDVCDAPAKRALLDAESCAYIQLHIPDCAWNGWELDFSMTMDMDK